MAEEKGLKSGVSCEYRVEGLDCPDCAATLERGVREVKGVGAATVHFGTSCLNVTLDSPAVEAQMRARVEAMGYRLAPIGETPEEATFWDQHATLIITGIAALAWIIGGVLYLLHFSQAATFAFAVSILVGGSPISRRAYGSLIARTLDLYVLMTIAVIGAAVIGEWGEGAAVVTLFAIGNVLEALTTRHARKAIGQLMAQAPQQARLRRDGVEELFPVEEAHIGDIALVRPGEKIPLDGMVIAGSSTVNEATITGESMPAVKGPGDAVYAGTLNERGALEMEVVKPFRESAFARIVQLVENAQNAKPRVQQQIDRFAQYYTPLIVLLAIAVAVIGSVLQVPNAIVRGLALLIIGCPCALVLASPIVILAGVARAARQGVLVKEGVFLEAGNAIRAIAFDKTGTLTMGKPRVTGIVTEEEVSEEEFLALAAGLEKHSEHPVAIAVRKSADLAHITPAVIDDFEALTGLGVRGIFDEHEARLGNPRLWSELPTAWEARVRQMEEDGLTVLLLELDGRILGLITLGDEPRKEAPDVVQTLQGMGYPLTMLSGDTQQAARMLGEHVGISDIAARLMPDEKVSRMQALRERFGPVAMVGDGVNDAPALASADLGIAVSTAGNDTAIASADVVLIANDLLTLPDFFALCRRAAGIIHQNIYFAIGLKAVLIVFAIAGLLPLWLAVVGDVGTTIIVILNGMRLLR